MAYSFLSSICQPYPLLLLALGLWMLRLRAVCQNHRGLWRTGVICYVGLCIVSTGAFAHLLFSMLEHGFAPRDHVPQPSDVIVVLTGGLLRADSVREQDELGASSLYRCHHAARLYQLQPGTVIVAGGKVDPRIPGRACSEVMRDCLIELGVRPADVVIEDRSRSTAESAVECRAILEEQPQRRVVLVTEAYHMRRAKAAFDATGLSVEPAPCTHRATEFPWRFGSFLPRSEALASVELACHELLGLAWYKIKGAT